jgi:hypothetical protein
MPHARTWPYYLQSNGKLERWQHILKEDRIRPGTPLTLDDARPIVNRFVEHYNKVRLHSEVSFLTPKDKLARRQRAIFDERDRPLEVAQDLEERQSPSGSPSHPGWPIRHRYSVNRLSTTRRGT